MPVFTAEKISYAAALLSNWKGREPQAVRDALDDLAALLAPVTLMAPNSVLVAVGGALPAGLVLPPGSILVRDLTTPTPDIKALLVIANRIVSTDSAGNWRAQGFTAGRLIRADAFGGLQDVAIAANRWLIMDGAAAPAGVTCLQNWMTVGGAGNTPTFLIVGLQGIIGRKAGNVIVHTAADGTFVGKEKAGVDWGNLSMVTARAMVGEIHRRKTADQGITFDELLSDDNTLVAPILANKDYRFKLTAAVTSHSQRDFRWAITIPAAATMLLNAHFFRTGTGTVNFTVYTASGATIDEVIDSNSDAHGLTIEGVISNAANPGNVAFRWAQGSSGSQTTTVLKNSDMFLKQVD